MTYYTLRPELVRHLLKGEVDELTDLNAERINKIKSTPCPRCGSSLHPKLNEEHPFAPNDPLPRMWMSCECGYLADAKSGLIVDRGSAMKVKDPVPIIRVDKD